MSTAPTTTGDPRQRTPEHTVVRMVNEGPEPFNGVYLGDQYNVPAGEQAFVPFYAMCLWAGHPDAVDISKKERYRTEELQRLQVKYGTHSFNGCWSTEVCKGNPDPRNGQKHPPHRHLPNIIFYAVDTNTPYPTVLADPEGNQATQIAVASSSQDDLANRAMRDLQTQVEQLQRDLAAMHNNAGTPTPPPAPAPSIPPQPGASTIPVNEDGEVVNEDGVDDGDDLPLNGPLDHAIPVSEEEFAESQVRKPRIPPAPGPLKG